MQALPPPTRWATLKDMERSPEIERVVELKGLDGSHRLFAVEGAGTSG
jgi:hypothetical protein